MITKDQLQVFFTYHPPQPDEIEKYARIRAAALAFAEVIVDNTPTSADQSAAIRHVRDAVMVANAAIACTPHLSAINVKT